MRFRHIQAFRFSKMRTLSFLCIIFLTLFAACSNAVTTPPAQTGLPQLLKDTKAPSATRILYSTPRPSITIPPTDSPPPSLTPFIVGRQKIRVEFKASDGQPLIGYFYPSWQPNAPVVILMHQRLANQAMWDESTVIPWLQNWPVDSATAATPTLSANGMLPLMPQNMSFAVFTFDFRGHGESMPLLGAQPSDEQNIPLSLFLLDAKAAYQTVGQMPGADPSRMIGIGASIGADAVVDACAIGCIGAFSVSPGSWLGVDYAQAVGNLLAQGKIVRCMYSTDDGPSPATCWSVAPGKTYQIFAYKGVKHGMTFFVPRKMQSDFGQNILEFLEETLQEK